MPLGNYIWRPRSGSRKAPLIIPTPNNTGTHTVTVKFDDGRVDTTLAIKAAAAPTDPTSPQTGDTSHMGLWVSLLCVSGAALAALIITEKKRKARS